MPSRLPRGTVTFLFSDIEGSTRLLSELGPARYADALESHRRVMRAAFERCHGVEVDTQGDSFLVAFDTADRAARAALEAQSGLAGGPVRVRIGLHTGAPQVTDAGYVGRDVHLGARIAAAAHGGQTLMSASVHDLIEETPDTPVRDLGEHRVKDFASPVRLYQLGDGTFPPLRTIGTTNLPHPASEFVGRSRELDEITALLRRGPRLVTLTGPGGSGKTRLAIEAARRFLGDFPDGVFWVPLATVGDPELVIPTIATAIGTRGEPAASIADRQMLLLLDNLEQVIGVARELAALLATCPNLHVLATSRELLRMSGEAEYEVLPLAAPEAVGLFCIRSGLDESASIEELCARLDNMPLAIELAAARARLLSPEQILERLGKRLDLFRSGRDAEPRQQTLRAAIEWSYDLLSTDEQRIFTRLACFAGCTAAAAEAVVDADLDVLQSLVDKSLLRGTGDRLWMLETIRAFAAERFDQSRDADDIRRRHALHYLAVAESTCLSVERIGSGPMRYDVALAEHDNFRAALDWAADHDVALGLRIAVELEQFWISRDPFEGANTFKLLLDHAADISPALMAAAIRVLGGCLQVSGNDERAEKEYERSLGIYKQLNDEWGIVHLRHRLATIYAQAGDWESVRQIEEEGLRRARRIGSGLLQAEAVGMLADLAEHDGDIERAIQLSERYLELSRQVGFKWFVAIGNASISELALRLGNYEEGRARAREAIALFESMRDRRLVMYAMAILAVIEKRRGDPLTAGTLWGSLETLLSRGPIGKTYTDRFADEMAAVGDQSYGTGRAQGHEMTIEAALEACLGSSWAQSEA